MSLATARLLVLSVATVVAVATSACQRDPDPFATPTLSVSPTAEATTIPDATSTPNPSIPEPCPVDQPICDFASEIQRAIVTADFGALKELMRPSDVTCPVSKYSEGFCRGTAPGDVRSGYRISVLQSHGGVYSSLLPRIRGLLIQHGDAVEAEYTEPHVIGIHCPSPTGQPSCDEQFIVAFSVVNQAGIPTLNLVVEREDDAFGIIGMQLGNTLEEMSDIFTHSGPLPFAWDGVREGWFYPWTSTRVVDPEREVPRSWLLAPPDITGVTVSPALGACPATLTISLAEPPHREPGKEPLPKVWIVAGVSGVEVGIPGRPPLVEQNPPWLADGRSFEVELGAEMLEGALCDGDTVSMLVWGADSGPVLVGYAIER